MDISSKILSEITIYSKFARYLPEERRRETWLEIVARNRSMHERRYPSLVGDIQCVYKAVEEMQVLPSMRSLQYGGLPIEKNPARMFNCTFVACDNWKVFAETMFLLLSGCGCGYSVQFHHVRKLPEIRRVAKSRRFLISDSIEGWADAVRALTKAYFFGTPLPVFDFSDIRPWRTPLRTAGGRAPGPAPLRIALERVRAIFERKTPGEQLEPIEVHDIQCHLADAISNGGLRRAAMISLFSFDDIKMLTAKSGEWWRDNPQRARANNSAMILRHRIKKKEFRAFWQIVEQSRSGEPAMYFSNDAEWGANPCCEIALRNAQMCNLTEINAATISTQADLDSRAKVASFIGTLQAGYTDFHYLRDTWRHTCDKDALIGVGQTGIATGGVLALDLPSAAGIVLAENHNVAESIGIREAARATCVKPAGDSSCVLAPCSAGAHAWHGRFFYRRMRINKMEPLYAHLAREYPELIEDDYLKPDTDGVITLPQRAPDGAILRSESALALLERVKKLSCEWVRPGHRNGNNTHNVSTTVSIRDNEWAEVGEWMWSNREFYNGLAVLPYDTGTYVQAPFEEITEAEYESSVRRLHALDLSRIVEDEDYTELAQQAACASGQCAF